jgi:hypothetical protein
MDFYHFNYLYSEGLGFNMLYDEWNNITPNLLAGTFGCYNIDFIQKIHRRLQENLAKLTYSESLIRRKTVKAQNT